MMARGRFHGGVKMFAVRIPKSGDAKLERGGIHTTVVIVVPIEVEGVQRQQVMY